MNLRSKIRVFNELKNSENGLKNEWINYKLLNARLTNGHGVGLEMIIQ